MRDFTYVSDYNWKSADCGWGSIKKDQSPSSNTIRLTDKDSQVVEFEKGLGTHAISTIVYDLTNIDAEYFSSYVGVDRAMYGSVGSVGFEVWLDGEKVAETDVIYSGDAMEYLEVNIAGAKELKLVAHDGGNGKGSDHAVWGDAKFHYANPNRVPVNKSNLGDLIAVISELDSNMYTEESWTNLSNTLAIAKGVMDNVDATQEQVNEAIENLTLAKENLVIKGNKEALQNLINEVYLLDSSKYTEDSWVTVAEVIAKAELVLANENATQTEIDAIISELVDAKSKLIIIGDKSALRDLINEVENLDKTLYKNWDIVSVELDKAWDVLFDANALTEDIVKATQDLELAVSKLELNINLDDLNEVLANLKDLDLSKYTAESVVAIEKAIEDGSITLEKAESQEEVDKAKNELSEVLDTIEISSQKENLGEVLKLAFNPKYDAEYTNSPVWYDFVLFRDYYKQIFESKTANTEEDLNKMVDILKHCIDMVENTPFEKEEVDIPVVDENIDVPTETPDVDTDVNTDVPVEIPNEDTNEPTETPNEDTDEDTDEPTETPDEGIVEDVVDSEVETPVVDEETNTTETPDEVEENSELE